MNLLNRLLVLLVVLITLSELSYSQVEADTSKTIEKRIAKFLEGSQLSSQIFLGYQYYFSESENFNEFTIKRGYITFRKNITPFLSGRITPDITIDKEGDGEGDVEMRLKYCFMELKHPESIVFFTEPSILVGQVYTPWFDFEEKINLFRVEGSHFLDRVDQLSTADFGVTVTSLLGGYMDSEYIKRMGKSHAGKYGSLAFGIYNGGGYHAMEKNTNKTFQWRLSLRPFPNFLPGLQTSFTGVTGKGNTAEAPEWMMYSGFLSIQQEWFTVTGQYFEAKGNYSGSLTNSNTGVALENKGFSIFSEVKLLSKKVSLIGRWDCIDVSDFTPYRTSRYIAGIAYHISGRNKVLLDYNFLDNDYSFTDPDLGIMEITFELAF